MLYVLLPTQIEENREAIRALLAPSCALSRGDYTVEDLIRWALEGRVSLITTSLTDLAALVAVDIVETVRGKYAMVLALGGQVSLLYAGQGVFDNWAALLGCTEVRMACQDSRMRLFRRRGFEKLYNICGYKIGERT